MFLLVSVRHVGAHPAENQHGVSIQISISLGKTFLPMSRKWNIPVTWILARVFAYLPPFISQILDFIFWTVFIFFYLFWMTLHWKPAIWGRSLTKTCRENKSCLISCSASKIYHYINIYLLGSVKTKPTYWMWSLNEFLCTVTWKLLSLENAEEVDGRWS